MVVGQTCQNLFRSAHNPRMSRSLTMRSPCARTGSTAAKAALMLLLVAACVQLAGAVIKESSANLIIDETDTTYLIIGTDVTLTNNFRSEVHLGCSCTLAVLLNSCRWNQQGWCTFAYSAPLLFFYVLVAVSPSQ